MTVLPAPHGEVVEQHTGVEVHVAAVAECQSSASDAGRVIALRHGSECGPAHVEALQLPHRTRHQCVGIHEEQPLHVVGHYLVHERLGVGCHRIAPRPQMGKLALHLISHGLAVEEGDALAVAGGNLTEPLLVARMDAVIHEEHLLRLVARVVHQETQQRDAGLHDGEVVDGIAEVQHLSIIYGFCRITIRWSQSRVVPQSYSSSCHAVEEIVG